MTPEQMIDYVRNNDLSDLIRDGEPAELAPPTEREVMTVRTVRLTPTLYDQLLRIATQRGVGTSVLMRDIIEQWVARQTEQQTGKRHSDDVVPVADLMAFVQRAARPAA